MRTDVGTYYYKPWDCKQEVDIELDGLLPLNLHKLISNHRISVKPCHRYEL